MSKLKQRARQRKRQHPRPRVPEPRRPPVPVLGGMPPEEIAHAAGLLAHDLRTAALKAQAQARGGASPAAVQKWFLTPLKRVYQGMDLVSAACLAQAPPALTPACSSGCFACCRLYVEVGPWEAFGIANYVTEAWEVGAVPREVVLARLHEEVARYTAHGMDGPPRLCAFLSRTGQCGIYPARPAACRAYYSISREACECYFTAPTLGAAQGPHALRTADSAIAAQLTMAEICAIEGAPFPQSDIAPAYEMQSAVLRILETPNALVRYLHGEDIFAGCARNTSEAELRQARQNLVQLQIPVAQGA
jgi:Fe-S-cluster containining protein